MVHRVSGSFISHQEIEKRKRAEAAVKSAVVNAKKQAFIGGPDFEVTGEGNMT